ncbi:MAG: hypothetical protein K1W25_02325, partial [Lachnospiraceae bacterium]
SILFSFIIPKKDAMFIIYSFMRLSCLFLRAMSQADAKHPFDEYREGQIPRSSAALQIGCPVSLPRGF